MGSSVLPENEGADQSKRPSAKLVIEFGNGDKQATYSVHGKSKSVCGRSLYVFGINSAIRKCVIWLVEWAWFDRFILSMIVINSILLSLQRYRYPDALENEILWYADYVFTPCFAIESLLKIIAYGLIVDSNSYLRDAWNWLDFIVVVTACISFVGIVGGGDGGTSFPSGIRVFRVLRPLRSLTMLPQMRVLVNTVLLSIPKLGNVLLMGVFLYVVFGILALNFWGGMLYRQCRSTSRPVFIDGPNLVPEEHGAVPCWSWPPMPDEEERLCGGRNQCKSSLGVQYGHCGSLFVEDPDKELRPKFCIQGDCKDDKHDFPWCNDSNPEDAPVLNSMASAIHFDHLPAVLLVIFQCMTLEGWTDIMYILQDAHNDIFPFIYFFLLLFVTSFFLLNVALAVIWEGFSEQNEKANEDKREEEEATEAEQMLTAETTPELEDVPDPRDSTDTEWGEDIWLNIPPVRFCRWVAFSEVFGSSIMFFILANVATMMMDQYPPPPPWLQTLLNACEILFNVVFTTEMVFMLVAVGPKKYVKNPVSCFDGVIVVASLVEMGLSDGGGAIRALRGFRLLRVFKLAKKWTSFRILLKSMLQTIQWLDNFTFLLVLMLYVFSLMAMNFFALQFHFEDEGTGKKIPGDSEWCPGGVGDQSCVPRAHFDTFLWAFVTIFQIMSGENWNTVMYDGMKAVGWPAVFFFLTLIIVGQCIIFNLFLAVLMAKFEESRSALKEKEDSKHKVKEKAKPPESHVNKGVKALLSLSPKVGAMSEDQGHHAVKSMQCLDEDSDPEIEDAVPQGDQSPSLSDAKVENTAVAANKIVPVSEDGKDASIVEDRISVWPQDYSFLVFGHQNQIRSYCKGLAMNKQFDSFILICIIISSLAMAIDNPLADPSTEFAIALKFINYIFSVIFCAEMVIKMIAIGCFFGKGAYWRNSWNILDGIVVIVSIVDWAAADSGMTMLKTLRILRAFRPLRVISRNESLKLVVNTLFQSLPELGNLLIVGLLFFLIFGLFGLAYFKGGFYACQVAGDDGLEGFTYATKVSFFDLLDTNGKLVGRSASDIHGTYSAVTHADLQMTPLCVEEQGWASALGSYDEDTEEFKVGGECAGAHYLRPSFDSPICVGHCDPRSNAKDKPRAPTDLCPMPLDSVAQFPSLCSDEDAPVAMLEAQKRGRVIIKPEDVERGNAYFEAMKKKTAMPCGSSGLPEGYKGCRETYCPDGSETEPDEGLKESCRDSCENHQLFCTDTCEKADSAACKQCRAQCQAACECPRFCDASAMEAAMCVEQGGFWIPSLSQNFDNIAEAIQCLFEISTTEGWVDVMYSAVDSRGPFLEPSRDENEMASLFFVGFILVGTFFILNLCVGVIVDNFNQIKDEGGQVLMTEEQMEWQEDLMINRWVDTQRNFMKRRQYFGLTDLSERPGGQRCMYLLMTSSTCETFIMCCIILNTILMGCKQFPTPSEEYKSSLEIVNYCFAIVFFLEAVLKLYALRENYFNDGWNIFDFTCVLATIIGFIVDRFTNVEIGAVMSGIRIFRIARLFRLVRFAKGLNRLFTAFILSIPRLLNVVAIMTLLLFLFSVLGVRLFAKIKFDGPHDQMANFQDTGRAAITLIRSMTGEAWNELMHSLSRDEVYFTQIQQTECYDVALMDDSEETWRILKAKCIIDHPNGCGTDVSYPYFVAYTWVITFVILNLVIAVILEGFEDSSKDEGSEIIDQCIEIWKTFDTNCDQKLSLCDTFLYVEAVAKHNQCKPLKLAELCDHEKQTVDLGKMSMRNLQGASVQVSADYEVHFIFAMNWALRIVMSENNPDALKKMTEIVAQDESFQFLQEQQTRRLGLRDKVGEPMQLAFLIAATKIQEQFRSKQAFGNTKTISNQAKPCRAG